MHSDPVLIAEDFAREQEATAAKRAFDLRVRQESQRHGRALAVIWAPVVGAVVLGLFALIGFVVHQVSTEHAKRVTVWCYADPNSTRATSQFSGSRGDVEGICPDAQQPAAGTNNP